MLSKTQIILLMTLVSSRLDYFKNLKTVPEVRVRECEVLLDSLAAMLGKNP